MLECYQYFNRNHCNTMKEKMFQFKKNVKMYYSVNCIVQQLDDSDLQTYGYSSGTGMMRVEKIYIHI